MTTKTEYEVMLATIARLRGMSNEEFAEAVDAGRQLVRHEDNGDALTPRWALYGQWANAVREELEIRKLLAIFGPGAPGAMLSDPKSYAF